MDVSWSRTVVESLVGSDDCNDVFVVFVILGEVFVDGAAGGGDVSLNFES